MQEIIERIEKEIDRVDKEIYNTELEMNRLDGMMQKCKEIKERLNVLLSLAKYQAMNETIQVDKQDILKWWNEVQAKAWQGYKPTDDTFKSFSD